jgi:uncharacterized phage protein (TIGR02218 family)
MRDIDANLENHFKTGATTLCRIWLVTRADGQSLGFTDHDRDLILDGVEYVASSGMDAQAVQATGGLAVNNSSALGALSTSGISEEDIACGKYDEAEITHSLVNWADTNQRLMQFRGSLGDIKRSDGVFEVELRGLTEKLNQPNGRTYARICSHSLADERCGVDLEQPEFKGSATIVTVDTPYQFSVSGIDGFDEGWFASGSIMWSGGGNVGASSVINLDHTHDGSRQLNIWEETFAPISVGDTFEVFAGCRKSGKACAGKFGNLLNFGGFPYLPGEDWSLAYPVRSKNLDGQSLFEGLSDE